MRLYDPVAAMIPEILYEDNHLLVCVKPFGMPSQEDQSEDLDMLRLLKDYIKKRDQKPGEVYLGLVHRLDRVTGGVMVFAKTSKAASRLSEQIRTHAMEKTYLAVIQGPGLAQEGQLSDYLYKIVSQNKVFVTKAGKKNARLATLTYCLQESVDSLHLVKVQLVTGRSHQIRVQFASRQHSLVGDQKYGSRISLGRTKIALFAYQLRLEHPVKKEAMEFIAKPALDYPWDQFQSLAQ